MRGRGIYPLPLTLLLLLLVLVLAAAAAADICDLDACSCDGFSGVLCACRHDHQEVTIQDDGINRIIPTTTRLEIYNCSRVYIAPKAILNLRELKKIKIANIDTLNLSERAFEWLTNAAWGLTIIIQNSTIPAIPSYLIKGRIDEFYLKSVYVHMMHSFAVSSLTETKHIEISSSLIEHIDTQAFKKISANSVTITNNTFNVLPSRTFSDVNIDDSFTFNNNKVLQIRSSFLIGSGLRKLTFENNKIGIVEGEYLKVVTEGNVFINNNTINDLKSGAFLGLKVHSASIKRYGLKDFYFQNNTVKLFQKESFMYDTSSYNILPKDILLDMTCDCSLWNSFKLTGLNNAIYCKYDSGQRRSLQSYKEDYCESNTVNQAILIIGIFAGILFILILFLVSVLIYRRYKKKTVICDQVRPEGRTYKETELYVIVEKTDLLTTDF